MGWDLLLWRELRLAAARPTKPILANFCVNRVHVLAWNMNLVKWIGLVSVYDSLH